MEGAYPMKYTGLELTFLKFTCHGTVNHLQMGAMCQQQHRAMCPSHTIHNFRMTIDTYISHNTILSRVIESIIIGCIIGSFRVRFCWA